MKIKVNKILLFLMLLAIFSLLKPLYCEAATRIELKPARIELKRTMIYPEKNFSLGYTYTGEPIKPEVELKYKGKLLTNGIDYKVMYLNNVNASTNDNKAQMVIIGKGNFCGMVIYKFDIIPFNIADTSFSFKLNYLENNKIKSEDKRVHDRLKQLGQGRTTRDINIILGANVDLTSLDISNIELDALKYDSSISKNYKVTYYRLSNKKIYAAKISVDDDNVKGHITLHFIQSSK